MNEATRYSVISGAYSPTLQRLIRAQVDEEDAKIQLNVVASPESLDALMAEVDRRADLMTAWWAERPQGHDCSPRTAALRSVTHDVCSGHL